MADGKKGTPTKLTPDLHAAFVQAVSLGAHPADVAGQLGITDRTYRNWIAWGRSGRKTDPDAQPGEPYASFFSAIMAARKQALNEAVQLVRAHGATDWRAAAWYAEKASPEHWGNRLDVTFTPRRVAALARSSGVPEAEIQAALSAFGLALGADAQDDLL